MGHLVNWLEHYGYLILFVGLFLEMLALPLPGEILMSYAGLLVFQGKLSWFFSILSSGLGAIFGMTLAYWIGSRLGTPFFEKYGSYIHLGTDKLHKVSHWFQKYGNKLIFIAFFIPGVRHITGYFSGVTRISFRKYALFAYSGAFFWTTTFISFGKVLGPKWELYHHKFSRYMLIAGFIAAGVVIVFYLYRKYKESLTRKLINALEKGLLRFQSLGKIRFFILAMFTLFVTCISLMIGLIQDYLAKEFSEFDEITTFIIHSIFGPSWGAWMNYFTLLGTYYVFVPIIIITSLWILFRGKDRLLELTSFAWVIVGGEALDEGLRLLFHRIGPASIGSNSPYTFPSEQTLISMTVCGFAAYLLIRHYGNALIRAVAIFFVVFLCLLVGISRVYFNIQYPSDVVSGYVFGGAWLSLNIIQLEVFRILKKDAK
ncbi:bifunctional DedA family/phosphatase PAP2 family protein [Paenibacillus azoreducens]|uniref:Phosphatidic acid phosphatase type 2/haloperoxidase domain-containing protein n=1 Tax=Paenibacillus azoreducens TaxID=116718 RepID=A0A919YG81_9BACL|nr:bifunctional DedA family/phosphatase PAP2 family protein [Paenibacillus azoreducens]GIO50627.1 hypothetical protein J34TS1_53920 [Paenibacillus azoreducens]